jgi:probable DNA metabolism protein
MTHSDEHHYYDGSFNGFLTLLYDVEYRSLYVQKISRGEPVMDALFPPSNYVKTREKEALLLWELMRSRNYRALKMLYFAFMSGQKNIENLLLSFFLDWFSRKGEASDITYDLKYRDLHKLAGDVEKEKNALERKLLLQTGTDDVCVRTVRPKYNVLPLISKYLRTRFRENEWFVFDIRRNYGMHHQKGVVSFIPLRKEHLRPAQGNRQMESSWGENLSAVGVLG